VSTLKVETSLALNWSCFGFSEVQSRAVSSAKELNRNASADLGHPMRKRDKNPTEHKLGPHKLKSIASSICCSEKCRRRQLTLLTICPTTLPVHVPLTLALHQRHIPEVHKRHQQGLPSITTAATTCRPGGIDLYQKL